jgi:hypothetical protein
MIRKLFLTRFFFLILFMCLTLSVRSQDTLVLKFNYPQKIHAIIKFNPIPILWGPLIYTGEYRILSEFTTSKRQSTQIGVGYLGKGALFKLFEDSLGIPGQKISVRGFRIQASHRFFTSRKRFSPQGFYISPHVSYAYARIVPGSFRSNTYYLGESNFNINLLVGIQFFIARTVGVDLFTGLGYKNLKFWDQYPNKPRIYFDPFEGENSVFSSNLKVSLGLNFGIVTKKIKTIPPK